jgi:hypothetical protein
MSEIMLWLSGVDRNVLSHCEGERNKFVAMGGTVLTTAALATLSATFTIHEFLHAPLFIAIVLGVGWGFAIMNLDRWLLISIRRQDTPRQTILMAAPRVFLAILVGAVIAHPLVLKAFDDEVSAKAEENNQAALATGLEGIKEQYASIPGVGDEVKAFRKEAKQAGNGAGLSEAPEYQRVTAELEKLERQSAKAQRNAICENAGTCGTHHQGTGPIYEEKKQIAGDLEAQVVQKRAEAAAVLGHLREQESNQAVSTRSFAQRNAEKEESKLSRLTEDRKEARVALKDQYADIGLLNRVEALVDLTFERPTLLGIEILLFLFVLAVDSMPAITKVMMSLGKISSYEDTQLKLEKSTADRLEQQVKAYATVSEKEAEAVIDEAVTRKALMKEVQDDLVRQSVDAMREAGEKFVELWREKILARVPRMVSRELARNGTGDEGRPHGQGGAGGPTGGGPAAGNGTNGGGMPREPEGP